jgi:hypothetical protein
VNPPLHKCLFSKTLWVAVAACPLLLLAAVWLVRSSPGEDSPDAAGPWFRDATDEVGLHFVHNPGTRVTKDFYMPGMVGSGAAVFDFDNDGRLDILLLQNGGKGSGATHRLFHQEPDGRFKDVSKGSGLDVDGEAMGVAIGDVNNDGLPDVLITEYGRVRLFLNLGGGKFRDMTKAAGLDNPYWGTSAAFVDYDRDGWLDLVVVNYVKYDPDKACAGKVNRQDFCGPSAFDGTATRLYRNLGRSSGEAPDKVRFEDVTTRSGLNKAVGPGLGVACFDFNGDGWPDILVANDGKPNHLWINQKNGTFKEEAVLYGLGYNSMGQPQANMGIAVGDVDGSGLFSVFITHLPEELNVCWKQSRVGVFQDRTAQMGLGNPRWRATGFGTVFGDFDLDGALDLAVANGAVRTPEKLPPGAAQSFWGRYGERNQLFANDGQGRFRDVSENDPFCQPWAVARGLVCADIDNDGGLDLLVTRVGGQARLYKNVAARRGHWLLVKAVDPALGGRDAYGAEVEVKAGTRRWKRCINPGYSYLCSNDPRAHFGLGPVKGIDAIQVAWPDGKVELFAGGAVDRLVVLRRGSGRPAR